MDWRRYGFRRAAVRYWVKMIAGVIPPIFDELSEAIPGIILKAA
ncbi:MAG TPA: hypothetical protein VGQ70_02515 [Candidatus Udaeobacter sp.]|jgi:hypothetical protein|nr:hypothetical protein [Candidatus Udaeobacter sp.]